MSKPLTPEEMNAALDALTAYIRSRPWTCGARWPRALDQLRAEHREMRERLTWCSYCQAGVNACNDIRDGKTCRERAKEVERGMER